MIHWVWGWVCLLSVLICMYLGFISYNSITYQGAWSWRRMNLSQQPLIACSLYLWVGSCEISPIHFGVSSGNVLLALFRYSEHRNLVGTAFLTCLELSIRKCLGPLTLNFLFLLPQGSLSLQHRDWVIDISACVLYFTSSCSLQFDQLQFSVTISMHCNK